MEAENVPQNLPKPTLDPNTQTKKATKCPMASPRKKKTNSVITPLQSKAIKQEKNEQTEYFGRQLTPVGGKKFYSVLDICETSPTPKRDFLSSTPAPQDISTKDTKRKRNKKAFVERSSLFKETKTSESKSGLLWVIWVILEWLGSLFMKYTAPTPIPEATKSKFKNRRTKSNRKNINEDLSFTSLGFTPAVRRPKPPL